jgi:hypothetical protein
MPVTLLCPRLSCRAVLRVPDAVRGKRVRCCECGMTFFVPAAGKPEPAGKGQPAPPAPPRIE